MTPARRRDRGVQKARANQREGDPPNTVHLIIWRRNDDDWAIESFALPVYPWKTRLSAFQAAMIRLASTRDYALLQYLIEEQLMNLA
jgi:hypothetical protein